jgi:WD40 repeat protein
MQKVACRRVIQLAIKAKGVFTTHCYQCHGEKGSVEGGLNFLLNWHQLVGRGKVTPGELDKSVVYQRVKKGEMPPKSVKTRPSPAEIKILEDWVLAGAPAFSLPVKRDAISHRHMLELIAKDLATAPEADRKFTRYITLTHFFNAGLLEDELDTYRHGLAKLVNGLSWSPKIVLPTPVDPARTIFRIDIRQLAWTKFTWTQLTSKHPYQVQVDSELDKRCQQAADAPIYHVRGDWLAALMTSDPVRYYEALQIPTKIGDLEKKLRVDVDDNIKQGFAVRLGVMKTALHKGGARVLERHESLFGGYWKTYEFTEKQGIFSQASWSSRGANEVIFHLPNGMLGFASGDGARRDSPFNVQDPRKIGQNLYVGMGCMSCHGSQGIIPRDDQVRDRVHTEMGPKNKPLTKDAIDKFLELHPPQEKVHALMNEDNERYQEALKKLGGWTGSAEPVAALALHYEADVDVAHAAGELGYTEAEFVAAMSKLKTVHNILAPLKKNKTVTRFHFSRLFSKFAAGQIGPAADSYGTTKSVVKIYRQMLLPMPDAPRIVAPENVLVNLLPTLNKVPPPEVIKVSKGSDHIHFEFPTHTGAYDLVAASPTQRLIAAESQPGVVVIFDPVTGEQAAAPIRHKQRVLALAFSYDGKWLITSSQDKTLRITEISTGTTVHAWNAPQPVTSLRISPDGVWLATLSGWEVNLYDVGSGKRMVDFFPKKMPEQATALAFSPDSTKLVLAGKTVRLWDLTSVKEIAVLRKHQFNVSSVDFSPDGKWLVSGGFDKTVVLWDVTKQEVKTVFQGHDEGVSCVMFAPDGKSVISADTGARANSKAPGMVKSWDIATGKETTLADNSKGANALAIGASGKLLTIACWDKAIRVWSIDSAQPLKVELKTFVPFQGHDGELRRMALSNDGKRILSAGVDLSIRLWNVGTGEELANMAGHEKTIFSVALAPDGKSAYSCSGDLTLRHWDLKKEVESASFPLDKDMATAVFSSDAKMMAVGLKSGAVQIVDPVTGKVLKTLESPFQSFHRMAFSPDGKTLAGCDIKHAMCVWDLGTGKARLLTIANGHTQTISRMSFSADGRFFVTGSSDRTICIWDVEKAEEVRRVGYFPTYVEGAIFTPDAKSIFVFTGSQGYINKPKDPKAPKGKSTSVLAPPQSCCVIQVDTATGKVVQYWDNYYDMPHDGVFRPGSPELIMSLGSSLKIWVPEKGKTPPTKK